MKLAPPPPPLRQHGAATLAIALVLLFTISFITLFASRAMIFEHRTSINQYRATQAFEAAQAGMEIGLANLSVASLRNAYIRDTNSDGIVDPATNTVDGSLPGALSYRVVYTNPTTGNLNLLRITSTGCADGCSPCTSSCTSRATVGQLVRLQPTLASTPTAALTAKGNVSLSGSATVTNTDTVTNGTTVHAGGTVDFGGSSRPVTLPGAPPASSVARNDTKLSLLSGDAFFQSYFGNSKATVQSAATPIACSGVCNSQLDGLTGQTIWVTGDGDTVINSGVIIGSASAPVILIVDGNLKITGGATVYGLVYCTALAWDNTGGGTSNIIGATLAEGDFTATGDPNPTYNPNVLQNLNLQNNLGVSAKIAGSWSDF